MTYDPVTYWSRRALEQGEHYVGPGSKKGLSTLEGELFRGWLRDEVEPVDFLLDFGCGSGRLFPALREKAATYLGVDIALAGLEHAAALAGDDDGAFVYHLIDYPILPFASGMIDAAVAAVVFQHVPEDDVSLVMEELARVLSPDAPVYVIDADPEVVTDPHEHVFPRDPERVGRMLGRRVEWPVRVGEHVYYTLVP